MFLFLASTLFAAPGRRVLHVFHAEKLWSVSASGAVDEIPLAVEPGEDVGGRGTTGPVVSPDGRRLAFTRDNDLWVHDLKTGDSDRLTRHGRKSNDTHTSVYVLITAWSPTGRQILYYIAHSEPEDPDGIEATREVRAAPYGFRLYDLDKKASRSAHPAGDFHLWLPDGRFLLSSSEADTLHGALMVQSPEQDLPERLLPVRGLWGQADASRDGRWIAAALGQAAPRHPDQLEDEAALTSRVVRIDLRNGRMTDVTESGSWSEYQAPRFSPNGARLAWVRQGEPDEAGFAKGAVLVDGVEVGEFSTPVEPRWITDTAIAVMHSRGINVIQVDGKVIIRRP